MVRNSNKDTYPTFRLNTGLCKPTIFAGLPRSFRAPLCFSNDCMHHTALNIPDLMLPLWRARFQKRTAAEMATWEFATLRDKARWEAHGAFIAKSAPWWPGSFDRIPRNPAEKLNSGYKAWEFMLYFYGIGPAAFFDYLLDKYYRNYCLMVRIVRTQVQHEIAVKENRQTEMVTILIASSHLKSRTLMNLTGCNQIL